MTLTVMKDYQTMMKKMNLKELKDTVKEQQDTIIRNLFKKIGNFGLFSM